MRLCFSLKVVNIWNSFAKIGENFSISRPGYHLGG